MLELTNAERAKYGAPSVELGNNPSPQIHAEQSLGNCYSAHWDLWGLKPLYRYALTGGDQYTAENGSGINYCPKASENYRVKQLASWEDEVRKTVAGWISSPGHHQNLIDPRHTVLHAGIAIGKYHTNMVQVFSGEHVAWEQRPKINGTILTAAGSIRDAYYDEDDDYVLATIEYHPPTQLLTRGQLAGTYCLETDIRVGALLKPLQEGWHYTNNETGREFTDYDVETQDNGQCVNPYELPADRQAPTSWNAANAQHRAAVELSNSMPDQESAIYKIVSERLDTGQNWDQFSIRADLTPILSHYGPGIYTVTIWATHAAATNSPFTFPILDCSPKVGRWCRWTYEETSPVATYPIWWHAEPTPGHPY